VTPAEEIIQAAQESGWAVDFSTPRMLGLTKDERTIAVALNASGFINAAATGGGFIRGGNKLDRVLNCIREASNA
jgi:hypothetical protein